MKYQYRQPYMSLVSQRGHDTEIGNWCLGAWLNEGEVTGDETCGCRTQPHILFSLCFLSVAASLPLSSSLATFCISTLSCWSASFRNCKHKQTLSSLSCFCQCVLSKQWGQLIQKSGIKKWGPCWDQPDYVVLGSLELVWRGNVKWLELWARKTLGCCNQSLTSCCTGGWNTRKQRAIWTMEVQLVKSQREIKILLELG